MRDQVMFHLALLLMPLLLMDWISIVVFPIRS